MSNPCPVCRYAASHLVHRHGRLTVLRGVDLDVMPGEIVGLIGPSGSGKSSLLHAAGLLERPTAGEVRIDGEDVGTLDERDRTRIRLATASASSTSSTTCCPSSTRARQRRPAAAHRRHSARRGARAEVLLGELGLAERLTHQPAQMSGGEQQRVAVARALANKPRLLLADEPTGNLDPATSQTVFEALHALVKDRRRGPDRHPQHGAGRPHGPRLRPQGRPSGSRR
jgi:lipoprotein-releasing system ATP-binding protein